MYRILRDLHLYVGLFASPFILLFAASVFFLNHGKVLVGAAPSARTCANITIPTIMDTAGPLGVNAARTILDQCQVTGEIGFLRNQTKEQRLTIPVWRPGTETTVTVDLIARSASVSTRSMGIWETIAYLHKSPGPHNAAIRGNWIWTRAWKWFADGTVYLLLFISATGVYLWFAIRAERRIGVVLLAAGAFSFCGTIYAVLR